MGARAQVAYVIESVRRPRGASSRGIVLRMDAKAGGGVRLRASALLVFALWTAAAVLGCHRDPYCDGTSCLCGGQPSCDIACTEPHGCDVACMQGSDCEITCGDDCQVTCQSASQCHAHLGAASRFECQDVSDCVASLGDGATALCNRIGGCHLQCRGACRVSCMQGSCDIVCASGGQATACGTTGDFVCDTAC
jgi:hypothetical protein